MSTTVFTFIAKNEVEFPLSDVNILESVWTKDTSGLAGWKLRKGQETRRRNLGRENHDPARSLPEAKNTRLQSWLLHRVNPTVAVGMQLGRGGQMCRFTFKQLEPHARHKPRRQKVSKLD